MIDEYLMEIQTLIDEKETGDEFTAPMLLGDRWAEISEKHRPQSFGSAFSQAVNDGRISSVEGAGINSSPRMSNWRKT